MKFLSFCCLFISLTIQHVNAYTPVNNSYNIEQTEEERQKLKAFSSLNVSGPFEVELIISHKSEIIIEGNKEAINNTLVLSKGKELAIAFKGKKKPNKLIKLTVYTSELREIELKGKAEVYAPETIKGRSLSIQIAEHASCYLDLDVENLKCKLTGAAQMELTGTCKQFAVETEDAAFLTCHELKAEKLSLKAKGASNSSVYAKNSLKVTASNAANILYYGNPKQKDLKSVGAVRLEANPKE